VRVSFQHSFEAIAGVASLVSHFREICKAELQTALSGTYDEERVRDPVCGIELILNARLLFPNATAKLSTFGPSIAGRSL